MTLFTSADGQIFSLESAKWLSEMEIWEGNRNILEDHVKEIEQSLAESVEHLNSTIFRVAIITTESGAKRQLLVDGQHRAQVLKRFFGNPFSSDFQVIVSKKEFNSEADIIHFFKIVNCTRAIEWREDPNMLANKHIEALLLEFQPPKKKGKPLVEFFRHGRTRKPYISIDLVRRRLLEKYRSRWTITPEDLIDNAKHYNEQLYERLIQKQTNGTSLTNAEQSMIETGFCLSLDDTLLWI